MNRIQYIYRKVINSLFGDVEVFFGLPLRWRIRGAVALGFLYLAIFAIIFLTLYPAQEDESFSVDVLIIGYVFLFIGVSITILPVFIAQLRNYPLWIIIGTLLCLMISFNIILAPVFYSLADVSRIVFLIGLLAIAFGARLYARVIREVVFEKTRIDTEVRLAQKIQTDLLPVIDIDRVGFEAYGKTVNAQEIGGDFFDVIDLDNGQIAFCVGDVSGHNIAAGLIMGIVKSSFRTELRYNNDLKSIVQSLNKTVMEHQTKSMFVSFAAGIINFERGEAKIINAGHPPLIRMQNGIIEEIRPEGAALGLSHKITYQSEDLKLSGGDILVCYSDGATEARNEHGEEFGKSGLLHSLSLTHIGTSASRFYEIVYNEIEKYSKHSRRVDDITLLIIRIK